MPLHWPDLIIIHLSHSSALSSGRIGTGSPIIDGRSKKATVEVATSVTKKQEENGGDEERGSGGQRSDGIGNRSARYRSRYRRLVD